jgi:hypothetical protein
MDYKKVPFLFDDFKDENEGDFWKFDYYRVVPGEIALTPEGKRSKSAISMAIVLIKGFNHEYFTELGDKGYLTGRALKDYQEGLDAEKVMGMRRIVPPTKKGKRMEDLVYGDEQYLDE